MQRSCMLVDGGRRLRTAVAPGVAEIERAHAMCAEGAGEEGAVTHWFWSCNISQFIVVLLGSESLGQ
jgi:hypothetical protein